MGEIISYSQILSGLFHTISYYIYIKYHRFHCIFKAFMQTAGLTGPWDLWGLANFGNRCGPCQKTTGSSFIDCTLKRHGVREIRKGRSCKVKPDCHNSDAVS